MLAIVYVCSLYVLVLTQDQLDRLVDPNNGYYMKKVDLVYDLLAKKHSNTITKLSNINADINNLRKNIFRKTLVLNVDDTLLYVCHYMNEMRVDDKVKFGDQDAIVTELTYRLDLELEPAGCKVLYDHIITTADEQIPARGDWFPNNITRMAFIHKSDPIGCKVKIIKTEWNKEKQEKDEKETVDKETETQKQKGNEETIEISFLQQSKQLSMLRPVLNREVLTIMPEKAVFCARCFFLLFLDFVLVFFIVVCCGRFCL